MTKLCMFLRSVNLSCSQTLLSSKMLASPKAPVCHKLHWLPVTFSETAAHHFALLHFLLLGGKPSVPTNGGKDWPQVLSQKVFCLVIVGGCVCSVCLLQQHTQKRATWGHRWCVNEWMNQWMNGGASNCAEPQWLTRKPHVCHLAKPKEKTHRLTVMKNIAQANFASNESSTNTTMWQNC